VPGPIDRFRSAGAVILLVVEDSDMRGYLRGCLVHETTDIAEVLEAASLSTAKRQVAELKIDVIIAEGTAASGTGLELYRALQAQDEFRGLPVILVVDEPIPDEVRRLSSVTLRVLARPFNAHRLCEAVRRTIKADARPNETRAQ
jgi:DNA-binding NtrC family response regulator